ncbi:MAG TPA: FprA family A-type flavoprotein [Myxococcota bacterium]|nr:FprA family A-type flavoprotein [Myxococcota bacterium]HRY94611.1 FprA family A-type flavoprotein [Myxococcota bacterium]HSA20233.1 FprA family A-type flavoprotein [Myxococcota bacterium]
MNARPVSERVSWLGAVDWDRRLFDSLIPLPDGTSYNAYLVRGSEKVALLDSVDPSMRAVLEAQLAAVPRVDYVVSHHAEQDHSGAIPMVLERYPQAQVLATPKGRALLMEQLGLSAERIRAVQDGERLSLGDRTLEFLHTPWVHWPETMVSYLREEGTLFSCDFLGSHIAQSGLYVEDEGQVLEAAKRYYAEIMQPFRKSIAKHLVRLEGFDLRLVAPSHGPLHARPALILDAYRAWATGAPKNLAVVAYTSMHGSTRAMVERLVRSLGAKGVGVQVFDLAVTDIGKLAMALVDAATLVVGTPTVLGGPHPGAAYAALLANALRPKARWLSVIGSYGWGGKAVEQLAALVPNLEVEVLSPVLCKGPAGGAELEALDRLAGEVAARHAALAEGGAAQKL